MAVHLNILGYFRSRSYFSIDQYCESLLLLCVSVIQERLCSICVCIAIANETLYNLKSICLEVKSMVYPESLQALFPEQVTMVCSQKLALLQPQQLSQSRENTKHARTISMSSQSLRFAGKCFLHIQFSFCRQSFRDFLSP